MEEFNRVQEMTSAELVQWSFLLHRMSEMEDCLAQITQNQPNGRLKAAQASLKDELEKRTLAKGSS